MYKDLPFFSSKTAMYSGCFGIDFSCILVPTLCSFPIQCVSGSADWSCKILNSTVCFSSFNLWSCQDEGVQQLVRGEENLCKSHTYRIYLFTARPVTNCPGTCTLVRRELLITLSAPFGYGSRYVPRLY